MSRDNRSKTDQILDLLLDALTERQAARDRTAETSRHLAGPALPPLPAPAEQRLEPEEPRAAPPPTRPPVAPLPTPAVEAGPPNDVAAGSRPPQAEWPALLAGAGDNDWPEAVKAGGREAAALEEPLPPIQLDRMLRRLAVALTLLLIVVNIPFNRSDLSLARAMPDAQSLIVRDGLVLKGSGEKIYVLENNQKRWITTLEAFEWHGYRWEQVNLVDDAFLDRFADGRPIYVLLKCQLSAHIYALEDGHKRWIKDIETFKAEGFLWQDVKFIGCSELRRLPTGVPIPADAGPAPEP
jgi:hypothetical protein